MKTIILTLTLLIFLTACADDGPSGNIVITDPSTPALSDRFICHRFG